MRSICAHAILGGKKSLVCHIRFVQRWDWGSHFVLKNMNWWKDWVPVSHGSEANWTEMLQHEHTCCTFTLPSECPLSPALPCQKATCSSWLQLNGKLEILTIDLVVHKLVEMCSREETLTSPLTTQGGHTSTKPGGFTIKASTDLLPLILPVWIFVCVCLCLCVSRKHEDHLGGGERTEIAGFTINQGRKLLDKKKQFHELFFFLSLSLLFESVKHHKSSGWEIDWRASVRDLYPLPFSNPISPPLQPFPKWFGCEDAVEALLRGNTHTHVHTPRVTRATRGM